ncbi:hypothetical protein QFC24_006459, partial [Naganishia onofrii]
MISPETQTTQTDDKHQSQQQIVAREIYSCLEYGGLDLKKHPRVFEIVREHMKFKQTTTSMDPNQCVSFDSAFPELLPLSFEVQKRDFVQHWIPRYGDQMAKALQLGTAIVFVETNIGGWTGNSQHLTYVVPYVLLGLERMLENGTVRPHLTIFDPIANSSRNDEEDLHFIYTDATIADRICLSFSLMAEIIRAQDVDHPVAVSIPMMIKWTLPAASHSADKGSVLHAIINTNVAIASRVSILHILDNIYQEASTSGQKGLRERLDVGIARIFQVLMWGNGTNLKHLGTFASNLHWRVLEEGGKTKRVHCPSWYDLALYECMIYITFIWVFGSEKLQDIANKNLFEKMRSLRDIADGLYDKYSELPMYDEHDQHDNQVDTEMEPSASNASDEEDSLRQRSSDELTFRDGCLDVARPTILHSPSTAISADLQDVTGSVLQDSGEPCTCSYCGVTKDSMAALKTHERTHAEMDAKPYSCTFPRCSYAGNSFAKLQTHFNT